MKFCEKCGCDTERGSDLRCNPCNRNYTRKWREVNREAERERARKWRAVNREAERERTRKWREANRETSREISRKWAKGNPDTRREKDARRRARKKGAGGTLTKGLRYILFAKQGGKCRYCKAAVHLGKGGSHMDHLIPLALGGAHEDENMVLTCPTCNLQKGDTHPIAWINKLLEQRV